MSGVIHGKIRGRTIELNEDPGLQEGQEVEVSVKPVDSTQPWGEGIRRSAGCMADDPDFESAMNEIYQDRKIERQEPDLE
ncbi:MAG: hypothetical protein ACJ8C4_07780 [Gemmataceae bacterium]